MNHVYDFLSFNSYVIIQKSNFTKLTKAQHENVYEENV